MDVVFVLCLTAVGGGNGPFVNTPLLFCRKYWLAEDRVLVMFLNEAEMMDTEWYCWKAFVVDCRL